MQQPPSHLPSPLPSSEAHAQADISYHEPPKNRDTPPFGALSKLFECLADERRHDKRRQLLRGWFAHWRSDVGANLYPVLRLILPHKDRERAVYGLKEKNLARLYIKLLALDKNDPDATRLLNWKKPSQHHQASGDFPAVFLDVVSKRSSLEEGTLTIDQLNNVLDDLAKNAGNSEVQSRLIQRVYNNSTAKEQSWIVRIILKDMHIFVKETTILDVFHPDAHDLFNTCSDLKKVAWELWDPTYRLGADDKMVRLFRAFTPMLCKRPTDKIEKSIKDMEGRTFIIEEKLDGERIQLHKRGNEYFYCSRKGKDYTHLYGKHVGEGSLTPYIAECFDERVNEIILDGELLVWDPVTQRNLPFGTLKTAALDKSKVDLNPRPCFKVFDLLYLNGMSLLHKSIKFRKRNLRACVSEVKGRIEFIEEFEGKTAKDVRHRMEVIMEKRGEGLVLKHPDSEYVLNGRTKDWIKVKPEYMDNMGETFDVLVVAGFYGSGRRGGGVSSLICAVLDGRTETEKDDDEPKFSTFCRVGSGVKYADYVFIRSLPWKKREKQCPPSFIQTTLDRQGIEDKGDLYLEPEDSFVVQVKAAEIVPSDQYHVGYTLRFPRVQMIRRELNISDCLTVKALLQHIHAGKKRKLADSEGPEKRRKVTKSRPTILSEFKRVNIKDVEVTSDVFEGMTFVVSSDPKSSTRDADKVNLLKLIKANGGTSVQIAKNQEGLLVVYDGATTPYDIKMIMKKDTYDIIRPQWLLDCVQADRRLPLTKEYFFYATTLRQGSSEYARAEGIMEDDSETEPEDDVPPASVAREAVVAAASRAESVKTEADTSFNEWFDVPRESGEDDSPQDNDSVTDPESDQDDPDDEDEWFNIRRSQTLEESSGEAIKEESIDDVKMGDATAMAYDDELIFRHLCFYFDSPKNARKDDMKVTSEYEHDVEQRLAKLEQLVLKHGGKIGELDDPKLTHVVMDKRDDSRRLDLMRKTSKPKRRNLVLSEFLEACIDENTLLNETDFAP